MNRHCQFSFVTTLLTAMATSTAMTTIAAQRPGWRTGTASSGAGRVSRSAGHGPAHDDDLISAVFTAPASTPHFFRTSR